MYKNMLKHGILTFSEEQFLFKQIANGINIKAHKDLAVECNLKLVDSIANKHASRGFDKDELFQEGVLGLIRAVELFEYKRGLRFSTYAVRHITAKITRYTGATSINYLEIPQHVFVDKRKIELAEAKWMKKSDKKMTILDIIKETGLKKHQVERILSLNFDAVSLDQLAGDESDAENRDKLSAMIEYDVNALPQDESLMNFEGELLSKCLKYLHPHEALYVKKYICNMPIDRDDIYAIRKGQHRFMAKHKLNARQYHEFILQKLRQLLEKEYKYKTYECMIESKNKNAQCAIQARPL